MIIRAYKSHNGRFGQIVEGQEYDSDHPLIKQAREEMPHLFKQTTEKTAETARRSRAGVEKR